MRRTVITTIIVVVLSSAALMAFVRVTSSQNKQIENFGEVKKGSFEIAVSSAGEIIAENYLDIRGPNIVQNRHFRVAPVRIIDIIPEGTIVSKGDYIATLDRSNFTNTLKDEIERLKTIQSDFDMKILDTSVVLSTLRDEIKDQVFALEEAMIIVEQSLYDPPAMIRQAEMEYDRNLRHLEGKKRLYNLRNSQAMTETRILRINLQNQKAKVSDLENVLAGFTIKAPADGMLLYMRDRMGNKMKSGSFINPFNPVVATLPDLAILNSRIFVSEIDIRKIKTGQTVQVTVDALDGKAFSGSVEGIANIGEQLPNSDSKVFEVIVNIEGPVSMLKPAMTTGNKVITKTYDNVLYVPIESVQAGADNIPYVFTGNGIKQVVIPGEANDRHIIIEKGLAEGTSVFLQTPEKADKFRMEGLELISELKDLINESPLPGNRLAISGRTDK